MRVTAVIHIERWSLLLLGAALRTGSTHFAQFLDEVDITPTTLIGRLEGLVSSGLMTYRAGTNASDSEYLLTPKGEDLLGVVTALDDWSRRWELEVPTPAELTVCENSDPTSAAPSMTLSLLGSFDLSVESQPVSGLSVGTQRLLVFLALHDRAVTRSAVAGTMWPEVSEARAGLSLRSALSRLDPATRDAVLIASAGLALDSEVEVDLHEAQSLARRLIEGRPEPRDLSLDVIGTLSQDLLPDWSDDWVVAEAEDWKQLRMNALESLALLLIDENRLGEAASAARAAIRVDPLRESGYVALIKVHLAKGDQSEALRVFDRYADLLSAALGLEPTDHLRDLISSLRTSESSG
ncbi:MAG: BTAD domain-containing putative transcriptional regulator [Rhodoglobus sp.]